MSAEATSKDWTWISDLEDSVLIQATSQWTLRDHHIHGHICTVLVPVGSDHRHWKSRGSYDRIDSAKRQLKKKLQQLKAINSGIKESSSDNEVLRSE